MKNANFTNLRTLLVAVVALFATAANAQTVACNDNVQISVDPTPDFNCTVDLNADMVVEGFDAANTYVLTVMDGAAVVATGSNSVSFSGYVGETLTVKVELGNNSCWGSISIEDKVGPVCDVVADYSIECNEDLPAGDDSNHFAYPSFADNCGIASIALTNQTQNGTLCGPNGLQYVRIWAATDASGNASQDFCTQVITVNQTGLNLPAVNVNLSCEDFDASVFDVDLNADNDTAEAARLALGYPSFNVANDGDCMYSISYSDIDLVGCGGLEKIIRSWSVINMCTNVVTPYEQVISLVDLNGPSIDGSDYTVQANVVASHPQPCKSTEWIVIPSIADACSDVASISMFVEGYAELDYTFDNNGNITGGYIPAPGLDLGAHTVKVVATDVCGNVTEEFFNIDVVDGIAPTTICKEITTVALTSNGTAVVPASSFDNGTYDNCCLDYLEVRRMDDVSFGPTVSFDCEDETVTVVFRAVDCYDNHNDCMVEVLVEDKIGAFAACPSNTSIDCDVYYTDFAPALDNADYSVLDVFGLGTVGDNCDYTEDYLVSYNVDQCGIGSIVRTWTAEDAAGNTPASCTQVISVFHVSDWTVSFPADFDQPVNADCDYEDIDFGAPSISNDECEMIAVSFNDTQFDVPGQDACFKIFRDWTVINWCTYDANNSAEQVATLANWNYNLTGAEFITYTQVIKVKDNVAPTVSVEDYTTQVSATSCFATFAQATVDVVAIEDGCSTDAYVITENYGELAQYLNVFTAQFEDVPAGSYDVTFTVSDPCGNVGTAIKTVTVEEKAPTAYCTDELVIDLMETGMAEVTAADFNFASSDNCTATADLSFAFSSDINNTAMVVTCDELGANAVEMWVFDADGLTDFCAVTLTVQNNNGADCGTGSLTVSGAVNTESSAAVNGVTVEINGGLFSATTTSNGTYEITGIAQGTDITVAPSLDDAITNGVTTFDIVKITQHILGIQTLDSAYKMIAADANNSATITTLDIVAIRKAILQISTDFPNNTSWRFVDAAQTMDSDNPFAFAEVVNINNVAANVSANFIAVKVGDVTGDANVSFTSADNRSVININAQDKAVKAGETVAVEFTTAEALAGYQFTLNFAGLDLVDVEYGVAKEENFGFASVDAGALTTSWNAAEAVNLDGEALFTAVFVATEDVQLSNALVINSKVTAAEAVTAEFQAANVALAFNGATANTFAVYQNTPNPFSAETVIGFNAIEAGNATVTFTSVEGKVLAVRTVEAAKGYNAITVNAANIAATGVVYYTVETANNTATSKMVIVK